MNLTFYSEMVQTSCIACGITEYPDMSFEMICVCDGHYLLMSCFVMYLILSICCVSTRSKWIFASVVRV